MSATEHVIRDQYGKEYSVFGPFDGLHEIIAANRAVGHHWFSEETMGFFNSSLYDGKVYWGRVFISSEADDSHDIPRAYTVRVADDDGKVATVGRFMQFDSFEDAVKHAQDLNWLAAGGNP